MNLTIGPGRAPPHPGNGGQERVAVQGVRLDALLAGSHRRHPRLIPDQGDLAEETAGAGLHIALFELNHRGSGSDDVDQVADITLAEDQFMTGRLERLHVHQ